LVPVLLLGIRVTASAVIARVESTAGATHACIVEVTSVRPETSA
jgi:hypothetical protein